MNVLTGAIPSTPDIKDREFAFQTSELLLGAMLPDATDVDVTDAHKWHVQVVNDCVSVTTKSQVMDLAALKGTPFNEDLGPMPLYVEGRLAHAAPIPGVGIPDIGSSSRLNLMVGRSRGLFYESQYPETIEHATKVPDDDYWAMEPVAKIGTCRRILGEGNPILLRAGIKAALQLAKEGKCSPPSGAMPVDEGYVNLAEGDVYRAKAGKVLGFHDQEITFYSGTLDVVGFASSWSKRLFLVSIDWLARYGFEFWIIENYLLVNP